MKKLLIHRHQYGVTVTFCNLKDFKETDLNEDQSVKLAHLCGLNFEPEKNESLDIMDSPSEEIKEITKDMLK